MNIRFVIISEGTSDEGLIPHLESLCIEAGANEVSGIAPDLTVQDPNGKKVGHALKDRIRFILKREPYINLLFLHRDPDSRDSSQRHNEILQVTISCGLIKKWVAVVPVQETEAWLLLDESAIRSVAGKPNGRIPLDLPRPANVENVASPKEVLKRKLGVASEKTGRRYDRFIKEFPSLRNRLLRRLPIGGPLLQVQSWVRMKTAIEEAIQKSMSAEE